MSADNGLIVTRLHANSTDGIVKYGVFYYSGDFDPPSEYFVAENAMQDYPNPFYAVIDAHKRQNNIQTEYGVYVHSQVVADCEQYLKEKIDAD